MEADPDREGLKTGDLEATLPSALSVRWLGLPRCCAVRQG